MLDAGRMASDTSAELNGRGRDTCRVRIAHCPNGNATLEGNVLGSPAPGRGGRWDSPPPRGRTIQNETGSVKRLLSYLRSLWDYGMWSIDALLRGHCRVLVSTAERTWAPFPEPPPDIYTLLRDADQ